MVRAFRNKFSSGLQNVKQNNSVKPTNRHFENYGKQVKNYVNRERVGLASSNLKDVTERIKDAHTSINRGVKTLMATLSADIKRLQTTPSLQNEVMQGKFKQIQEYIKKGKFATRVNNPGNKSINPIMAWDKMRNKMLDAALKVEVGVDKIENLLMKGDFDAARIVARNVNSSKNELSKLLARAVNVAKVESLPEAPTGATVNTKNTITKVNEIINNANKLNTVEYGKMTNMFNKLKTEGVTTNVITDLRGKYTKARIQALNTKLNSNNANVLNLRPELVVLRDQPGVANSNSYKTLQMKYAKRFYTKQMGNSSPFNGLNPKQKKSVLEAVLSKNKQNKNKNASYFTRIATATGSIENPLATSEVRAAVSATEAVAAAPAEVAAATTATNAANANAKAKNARDARRNNIRKHAKNVSFTQNLSNDQVNKLAASIKNKNAKNLTLKQIKNLLTISNTPEEAATNVAVATEVVRAEATANPLYNSNANGANTLIMPENGAGGSQSPTKEKHLTPSQS